jgi:hypothetical protein
MVRNNQNTNNVIRAASARGLYVLTTGSGPTLKHEFWDRTTGKWVMAYYPQNHRWLRPGNGGEGTAPDVHAALLEALGPVPTRAAARK